MAFDKEKRVCPRYEIRLMRDDDIDEVLDIWKEIGLYEGKHSIQTFKTIDPKGFYVAVNLEDGKIIGCCAGVDSHPTCIFIGLYAVRKKYQGLGIGLKTFQAVMKHVGNKNAGLYPIEHHLVTYRDKAGFSERDTHEVIVYEIEEPVNTNDLVHHISNVKIEPIREEYMNAIAAFDERIVKHNREKLLRLTFLEPETVSRVAIDLDNGNVLAYGSLRLHNTDKVLGGPIYALNDGVAELLVYNLIKDFPPVLSGLTLMIPDVNYGAQKMAKKLKIVELYRLCRLFTKSIPKAEMEKIYCIHSPNFYPF